MDEANTPLATGGSGDSYSEFPNPWNGADEADARFAIHGLQDLAKLYLSNPQLHSDSDRITAMMTGDAQKTFYNVHRTGFKGRAIIINNIIFTGPDPERQGSKGDAAAMLYVLNGIGFQTSVYENVSRMNFAKILQSAVTDSNNPNIDAFALVVLSHGKQDPHKQDVIVTSDSQEIPFQDIISLFASERAVSLAGKPKLFFIQACRGHNVDDGRTIEVDSMDGENEDEIDAFKHTIRIPAEADILVAYSTVPGYYSWRNPELGAWFIQFLARRLKQGFEQNLDIFTILTLTANDVSHFESNTPAKPHMDAKKQVPWLSSTLTKMLKFKPIR